MSNSVPDTQLGLTQSEIQLLRQHQQIALSQAGSSSRAASHASSQGRLLLDPSSLQALSAHFDRLMYSIQQRWQAVSAPFLNSTIAIPHLSWTAIDPLNPLANIGSLALAADTNGHPGPI